MEREVIQGLIDRGLPAHIAIGIAGNMAVESRFDPGINEINPIVAGSRGGYGLNQWTGPRRRQYESYASDRGAALNDLDTQLDFTLWELANTEKRAGDALMSATTPEDAARIYSEKFLRPGIPHLDRRIAEARRLADSDYSQPPQEQPFQPPTQNALAQTQQLPQEERNALYAPAYRGLDPRDFMSKRNQLASMSYDETNPYLRALT